MFERLIMHWVYGGALAGILLLIMFPLLTSSWSVPLTLTFFHLPMYMLHQYEEHDKDRFRIFFNETIGGGKEVLSPLAVFIINVPGVWGVIAIATYLAANINIGLGLIAVYLAVINGLVHIGHALLFKRYNPGLVTGQLSFCLLVCTVFGSSNFPVVAALRCRQSALSLRSLYMSQSSPMHARRVHS